MGERERNRVAVKETAFYHLDKMRECIETENWLGVEPHLKYLGRLMFYVDLADERAMIGLYTIWVRGFNEDL